MRKKVVTITLTEQHHQKLQEISKQTFGSVNVSGLIAYWITKYDSDKNQQSTNNSNL